MAGLEQTDLRTPDTTFVYTPIDHNSDQIRVLRIEPGRKQESIKCKIQHVSLASVQSQFNCLSYTWGDELPAKTILVDGRRFSVRLNLHQFLTRASESKKIFSKPIWIDAICLDQSNAAERNHQVQRMAQIYKSAEHVFIWLGPSQWKTSARMRMFTYLHLHKQGVQDYRTRLAGGALHALRVLYSLLMKLDAIFEFEGKAKADERRRGIHDAESSCLTATFRRWLWRPVGELDGCGYWQRIWTVQEVVLARNPLIVYSNGFLPLYRDRSNSPLRNRLAFNYMHNIREWNETSLQMSWPLEDALERCIDEACHEPRDRLFALRGLLSSHEADGVVVDYTMDTRTIYMQQAQHLLTKSVKSYTFTKSYTRILLDVLPAALGLDSQLCCHHNLLLYLDHTDTSADGIEKLKEHAIDSPIYHIIVRPQSEPSYVDGVFNARSLALMYCEGTKAYGGCSNHNATFSNDRVLEQDVRRHPSHPMILTYRVRHNDSGDDDGIVPARLDIDFSEVKLDVDELFDFEPPRPAPIRWNKYSERKPPKQPKNTYMTSPYHADLS